MAARQGARRPTEEGVWRGRNPNGIRVARERRALREWAEENGKLKTGRLREEARGGEHIVEVDEAGQRVLKATRPEANFGFGIAYGSGATLSQVRRTTNEPLFYPRQCLTAFWLARSRAYRR